MGSLCPGKPKVKKQANVVTASSDRDLIKLMNSSRQLKNVETTTSLEDIKKVYKIRSKVIGHGHYGVVRLGNLITHPDKNFAIKTVEKSKLKKDLYILMRELTILMALDHPNIVKFYETYQDENYFHIVMEYCEGGDLIERITASGNMSELYGAKIIYKILFALSYLHDHGICHRDVKPENFLFVEKSIDSEIKVIDFGLSKQIDQSDHIVDGEYENFNDPKKISIVGTPLYIAPESLKGKYDLKGDIWSLGVILFFILSGSPPFVGDDKKEVFDRISKGNYSVNGKDWKNISKDCKRFISKVLCVDLSKRYTAHKALMDPWFQIVHKDTKKYTKKIDAAIIDRLKNFQETTHFKKEVLRVMVKMLSENELKNLREAFLAIDEKKNGFIAFHELQKVMKEQGIKHTESEIRRILKEFNIKEDENGINYTEFITATLDKKHYLNKEKLWLVFKYFDVDNTNFITIDNLREAMARGGKKMPENELATWMMESGAESSNRITFEDFTKMMAREGVQNITMSLKQSSNYESKSDLK